MFLFLVMLRDANDEETSIRHAKQTLQQFNKLERFK